MGHIHTRYENPEKKYYNPGAIECVRITDNPFNRGFYYVTLDLETKKVETEFKIVKTRNSIILDIDIEGITKEEECEKKIIEKAIHGTMNIDIHSLKEKIAEKIPFLHQEIINLIRYVTEDEIVITKDISREDIDKLVLEREIEKSGFQKKEVEEVYNIIEKLKEYGEKETIDVESSYGEEIEKMLIKLVEGDE